MNVSKRVALGRLQPSSKPIMSSTSSKTPTSRVFGLMTLFLSTMCILIRHTTSSPASNMMTLNSELVASTNQSLLSPGGVFEVGFTAVSRPPDGASPMMIYTLAIWYAQILSATSGRTIVWMADRSMNLGSMNATLRLSAEGNLEVYNGDNLSMQQPLWSSSTTGLNVSSVAMEDTGNLVLLNNLNQIVWQSFDNPTDTLLPGQKYVASANISMYAWQRYDNYTQSGCHVLNWGADSTLMARWVSPKDWLMPKNLCYWTSWLPSKYVILTTEGHFLAKNSLDQTARIIATSVDVYNATGARLNRLTFDYDGILRMYSWDVSGGSENSWSVVWTGNSICSVWNYCGPYSICVNDSCICTEGFQFVDPNDPTQGCTRLVKNSLSCTTDATTLQMNSFASLDYPFADKLLQPFVNVSLSFCLQTCMDSCTCEACVYTGSTGHCWLKTTLFNGRTSYSQTTYIKFAAPQSHSQETSTLSTSLKRKMLIAFPSLGAFILTLTTLLCTIGCISVRRKVKILQLEQLEAKWTAGKGLIIRFTYNEIQLATKNFAQEIGKGGAGTVFKAEFGKSTIAAVKRLDKLHQAKEEKAFRNEIETIGLIRHVNLVELHGYCATADQKLLVYEYVENSSLDKALFCTPDDREHVLEWRCRYKIALQTARAINYLHEDRGRGTTIIHCDIKPENILLDSTMSAKVADFGLARILNWERSRTMTVQIHGTRGYMAPEWRQTSPTPITTKIDVYSFGMVLLEIVSGRRNLQPSSNLVEADIRKPDWYFPLWALAKLESGSCVELVDPSLTGIVNPEEVERALQVAFWCINDMPEQRPSMSDVVQMLEGEIPVKRPVPRPKFLEMLMISSSLES